MYQPFALVTILVLTRYEARINTRLRILVGYTLFFIFVLLIPVVSVNNKSSEPHTLFLILTKLHDLTSQAIQDVWHRLVLICYKYHRTPQFDLASHSRYTLSPCIVPLPQNPMIWTWSMSVFWKFHLIDRWSFSCVWGDKALDPCVVFCSVEVLHTVSLQGLSITNWDFTAGVGICVVGFSHPWTRWNWALHWHLHLRGGIRICRCTRARRHVRRGFIHACSLCSGVPQKQKQNK